MLDARFFQITPVDGLVAASAEETHRLVAEQATTAKGDIMSHLTYMQNQPVSLKGHPEFDKKWLQDRIAEDPTILGPGEIVLIDRECSQEQVGRLVFLLSSPKTASSTSGARSLHASKIVSTR